MRNRSLTAGELGGGSVDNAWNWPSRFPTSTSRSQWTLGQDGMEDG